MSFFCNLLIRKIFKPKWLEVYLFSFPRTDLLCNYPTDISLIIDTYFIIAKTLDMKIIPDAKQYII